MPNRRQISDLYNAHSEGILQCSNFHCFGILSVQMFYVPRIPQFLVNLQGSSLLPLNVQLMEFSFCPSHGALHTSLAGSEFELELA